METGIKIYHFLSVVLWLQCSSLVWTNLDGWLLHVGQVHTPVLPEVLSLLLAEEESPNVVRWDWVPGQAWCWCWRGGRGRWWWHDGPGAEQHSGGNTNRSVTDWLARAQVATQGRGAEPPNLPGAAQSRPSGSGHHQHQNYRQPVPPIQQTTAHNNNNNSNNNNSNSLSAVLEQF